MTAASEGFGVFMMMFSAERALTLAKLDIVNHTRVGMLSSHNEKKGKREYS